MKNPRQFPIFFYILPPTKVPVNKKAFQIGGSYKFQRFKKMETFSFG
jgi:hypothetical protein